MADIGKDKISRKHGMLILAFLVFLAALLLDFYTKNIIVADEKLIFTPVKVIPGFFNIVSVRNTGAAWGMFHGNNAVLLSIALIVFVLLCLFYRSITEGWVERFFALALVLSGILGNSIDRITRGSVVDFLDFYIGSYHWPAFNVADSAICVGVFILIISFLFRPAKETGKTEK